MTQRPLSLVTPGTVVLARQFDSVAQQGQAFTRSTDADQRPPICRLRVDQGWVCRAKLPAVQCRTICRLDNLETLVRADNDAERCSSLKHGWIVRSQVPLRERQCLGGVCDRGRGIPHLEPQRTTRKQRIDPDG